MQRYCRRDEREKTGGKKWIKSILNDKQLLKIVRRNIFFRNFERCANAKYFERRIEVHTLRDLSEKCKTKQVVRWHSHSQYLVIVHVRALLMTMTTHVAQISFLSSQFLLFRSCKRKYAMLTEKALAFNALKSHMQNVQLQVKRNQQKIRDKEQTVENQMQRRNKL